MDKPYTRHLITPFIAIENDMEEGEDPQVRGAGEGGGFIVFVLKNCTCFKVISYIQDKNKQLLKC